MSLMVEFRERYKEGKEDGVAEGVLQEKANGIRIVVEIGQEDGKTKEELIDRLISKYSLSEKEAQENILLYWKENN